jgi:hypothetical protein
LVAILVATLAASSTAPADELTPAKTPASQPERRWQTALDFETRYVSWSGTRGYPSDGSTAGGRGAQFYTPATLQAVGRPLENIKVELLAKSGYVWSRQSTAGSTGEVSTLTDTVLSGTVTYLGIAGFQPFVSLNLNAPTGQSVLKGAAANARMDPDIVDLGTFGEGWNIGPTVGATIPVNDMLTWSFGVGHTVRGPYDREGPAAFPDALIRIDPGEVTTANAALGVDVGRFVFQTSASYSTETKTYRAGVPSFRLGDRIMVVAATAYSWSQVSRSIVQASWSHFDKNYVLAPPSPDIVLEAFNSNSNVFRVRVEHAYRSGNWLFTPVARWMLRDANSYSPTTLQFVPAKTLWGAGAIVTHTVNRVVDVKASVEHFWVRENENPAVAVPTVSLNGWTLMVGAVITP